MAGLAVIGLDLLLEAELALDVFPDMLEEVLLLAATGRLAVTVLGSLVTSLLSAARGLDTNGFLTLSSGPWVIGI